jgi:hypothetical protein
MMTWGARTALQWSLDGVDWQPCSEPPEPDDLVGDGDGWDARSKLWTKVVLGGGTFALEAIEVVYAGERQESRDPSYEDDYDLLYRWLGADEALPTIEIDGRPYVVFMTPIKE